jgi:hypothetical protein
MFLSIQSIKRFVDLPQRWVADPRRGATVAHHIPARLVLAVVMAAADREVVFGPNDFASGFIGYTCAPSERTVLPILSCFREDVGMDFSHIGRWPPDSSTIFGLGILAGVVLFWWTGVPEVGLIAAAAVKILLPQHRPGEEEDRSSDLVPRSALTRRFSSNWRPLTIAVLDSRRSSAGVKREGLNEKACDAPQHTVC